MRPPQKQEWTNKLPTLALDPLQGMHHRFWAMAACQKEHCVPETPRIALNPRTLAKSSTNNKLGILSVLYLTYGR